MSFILPYNEDDSFEDLNELSNNITPTAPDQFFSDANSMDTISLCKKYSLLPAKKLIDIELSKFSNIENRFGMSYYD